MSLRFPADLRARVKRYAASRGLEEATAVRALCADRLEEVELGEEVLAAERWQLSMALQSWDQLEVGKLDTVLPSEVRGLFADARRAARKPGARK